MKSIVERIYESSVSSKYDTTIFDRTNYKNKKLVPSEDEKNNKCDCHLYVITKEMMGTYSIAEIVNSAWQAIVYGTTVSYIVFAVLDEGTWQKHERKSFDAIMKLVYNIAPHNSVCKYVTNMNEVADIFRSDMCTF